MYHSHKVKRLLKTVPRRVPEELADGFEDVSSRPTTEKRKPSSTEGKDTDTSDDDSDGVGNISMERTAFGKLDQPGKALAKRIKTTASASSSSNRSQTNRDALKAKRRKVSSSDDESSQNQNQGTMEKAGDKKAMGGPPPALREKPKPPPSSSLMSNTSQDDPYFGGKKHKPVYQSYGQSQGKASDRARAERPSREQKPKKQDEFKKATFRSLPSDDKVASPKKKRLEFKTMEDSEASSPDPPPVKFRLPPNNDDDSQASTSSLTQRVGPSQSTMFNQRFSNQSSSNKKKGKTKRLLMKKEEQTPKAVFIDIDTQDLGPVDENVDLTSDEDSSADAKKGDASDTWDDFESEAQHMPTSCCPWCGDEVDDQLLKDFSRGERMNVRRQAKFCQEHKKHAAREAWGSRGYPDIDWDELPHRIVSHYDTLLDIIDGRKSHYRTLLARKIEAGEARSLKKEENLNPGYYGPRGFNIMCDRLVERFGTLLKERAVEDRVISGRGSAAFIQAVLVAELAILLIMDDMMIESYDEAQEIMEESKALGEIVNEDV